MKRKSIEDDVIPVHSEEASIIINKIVDEAVSIFNKYEINMPLNECKKSF